MVMFPRLSLGIFAVLTAYAPVRSHPFVQIPLTASSRRVLQDTPKEEEGHPQQVDALYQGYGTYELDSFPVWFLGFLSNSFDISYHIILRSLCFFNIPMILLCGLYFGLSGSPNIPTILLACPYFDLSGIRIPNLHYDIS
jgi:hypothetical protein